MSEATIQIEALTQEVIDEAQPLLELHHQEIALFGLEMRVNWAIYLGVAAAGNLRLLTARDGGKLVGYLLGYLAPAPLYEGMVFGTEEALYLLPEYRGSGLARDLLRAFEDEMRVSGAQVVQCHSPNEAFGNLLERKGYTATYTVYNKKL